MVTEIVQVAVCGGASPLVNVTVVDEVPSAAVSATFNVAVSMPLGSGAGVTGARVMPATGAEVIAAAVTVPSESVAPTAMDVAWPTVAVTLAGHVGAIGEFGSAVPFAAIARSSMANPSSEPVTSMSVQRSVTVAPGATLSDGIVAMRSRRLTASLPFSAPAVPVVIGEAKASAATSANEPVASVLKVSPSAAGVCVPPKRHCSPK